METKLKPFDKVLVRDKSSEVWQANLYSYYKEGELYPYVCVESSYDMCIPFEGNEHLLGTTDDYEEPFEPKDGDFVKIIDKNNDFNSISIYFKKDTYGNYWTYVDKYNDESISLTTGVIVNQNELILIQPATEEEKQTLLNALHEKGKDWDAEKKEIVDYKWKPKEGELIYYPQVKKCLFVPFNLLWHNCEINQVWLNKGWVLKTEEECQALCDKLNKSIKNVK